MSHPATDTAAPAGRPRSYTIIVNGQERTVETDVLTFQEIVELAFDPVPTGPYVCFTISFRRAAQKPHDGTLTTGGSVEIKNRTVFNVTATDKS